MPLILISSFLPRGSNVSLCLWTSSARLGMGVEFCNSSSGIVVLALVVAVGASVGAGVDDVVVVTGLRVANFDWFTGTLRKCDLVLWDFPLPLFLSLFTTLRPNLKEDDVVGGVSGLGVEVVVNVRS